MRSPRLPAAQLGTRKPLFLFTVLKMQNVGQKYLTAWGYVADPLIFVVTKEIWASWQPPINPLYARLRLKQVRKK